MDQKYHDSFQQVLKMTKAMYDAGIRIVAGTDALAGFSLHRELELYAQAGIPAPKVLQLDTLGAARIMKRDNELGSIVPGKLADVILVDGDPSVHISDIRRVTTVVKDFQGYGCVVSREISFTLSRTLISFSCADRPEAVTGRVCPPSARVLICLRLRRRIVLPRYRVA
jgi:hypothetical protein